VVRAAFVMEQSLGHVTVAKNLSGAIARQANVRATWLPIDFGVRGLGARVPLYRSNWSVRASARALGALAGTLARQRHDALLFHTQVTSLFSVPLMRRMPSVVSLDATPLNYDGVGVHYGHQPAGDGVIDRVKRQMNRAAFGAAHTLVCWSDWAKDSLIRDYGVDAARVQVIAPGAAQAYFQIGRERLARRPGTEDAARPVRLLFVGGDFKRKGGLELLEAVRGGLGRRCVLDVVTGADVPLTEEDAHVRVHRNVGPNSPELLRLFAEADLFVLPSHADCLAIVLMEATAAALPVVTTDVGALREAVIPDESGLIVPPGNVLELRSAIDHLVGLARARFDADDNNRALLDLLAQLA
jgi:glycosyltransferase involved in cell wall biosynthesis